MPTLTSPSNQPQGSTYSFSMVLKCSSSPPPDSPPRFSPCKTHSREMAQTSGFNPTLKVKHVLTARCLMSLIGLHASMEKMVPEGRLHMGSFQFDLNEHWRYPQSFGHPPSLVRDHFSSPKVVAKPCKCDEGCRPGLRTSVKIKQCCLLRTTQQ